MKIKIGFETYGDYRREVVNTESVKELYRLLGGRTVIGKFIMFEDVPEELRPFWPRVEIEKWNCVGPRWSHYKREVLVPVKAVKFGELGQASSTCPFCGKAKCEHFRWKLQDRNVYYSNKYERLDKTDLVGFIIDEIIDEITVG
jgi:hypothetical protein